MDDGRQVQYAGLGLFGYGPAQPGQQFPPGGQRSSGGEQWRPMGPRGQRRRSRLVQIPHRALLEFSPDELPEGDRAQGSGFESQVGFRRLVDAGVDRYPLRRRCARVGAGRRLPLLEAESGGDIGQQVRIGVGQGAHQIGPATDSPGNDR